MDQEKTSREIVNNDAEEAEKEEDQSLEQPEIENKDELTKEMRKLQDFNSESVNNEAEEEENKEKNLVQPE